jgi:hypothetical protein
VEAFVVQIWTTVEETDASRDDLRGFIEHVDSGRREPLRTAVNCSLSSKASKVHNPQEVD